MKDEISPPSLGLSHSLSLKWAWLLCPESRPPGMSCLLQLILTQTGAHLILVSSFFQSLEQKLWGGDIDSFYVK